MPSSAQTATPRGETPGADTVRALAAAVARSRALATLRDTVWPGFRPDTIPVALVIRGRGTALLNWGPAIPDGWTPIPGVMGSAWRPTTEMGASNTNVEMYGRRVAQVVTSTFATGQLAPLAAHEAFHVFQRASARPDRRFGSGENSYFVSQYPVFDADNETAFALEGRILAAALDARSGTEQRTLAQQFVAVREARHRRLPAGIAEFESMSELNEGLAEYVQLRALDALAHDADARVRDDASRELASRMQRVPRLTADVQQSIRLRYYVSGSAIALLLDRVAGSGWKSRLVRENVTLQELLALSSGARDASVAASAAAERRFDAPRLAREATARIGRLASLRRAQADSALAAPGIAIVLDGGTAAANVCRFDPQNLLRVSPTVELHARFVKVCGAGWEASFETKVVRDETAKTFTGVIADSTSLTLTIGGAPRRLLEGDRLENVQDVSLVGTGVAMKASRADVERVGRTVRVRPRP